MLQQLTKRERTLALAVLAFALVLGLYNLICLPLVRSLGNLDRRIETTEAKLLKSLRLAHQAARINEEYERLAPVHQFKGTDEEMISALLRSIEALARTAGVTITDIKPQPGKEAPSQRKYEIEMDTEASMSSLFQFLQGLETSPEMFSVQKMNLAPKGMDSKTLRAHITISRIVWA